MHLTKTKFLVFSMNPAEKKRLVSTDVKFQFLNLLLNNLHKHADLNPRQVYCKGWFCLGFRCDCYWFMDILMIEELKRGEVERGGVVFSLCFKQDSESGSGYCVVHRGFLLEQELELYFTCSTLLYNGTRHRPGFAGVIGPTS